LEQPKEMRLHQHHGHFHVDSDSEQNRDCTLDFAVAHLFPGLQAPRTSANNFRIQQTAKRDGKGKRN
jgi:hypothetical protein